MNVLIPKKWSKGSFQETIFDNVSVIAGAGPFPSLVYSFDFELAGPGNALWVKYNAGTPGNSLSVSVLYGPRGSGLLLPPESPAVSVADSASQGAVIAMCDPGCPDFQVLLESTGVGADAVTVILCGRINGCSC